MLQDVDLLLYPADPMHVLRRFQAELDRMAELDRKVRDAMLLLEQHFSLLPEAIRDAIAPLLYLRFQEDSRGRFTIMCDLLGFGATVHHRVQRALTTTLRGTSSKTRSSAPRTSRSDVLAARLKQASDELRQVSVELAPDDGPTPRIAGAVLVGAAVGFAMGWGYGYLASELFHHHAR